MVRHSGLARKDVLSAAASPQRSTRPHPASCERLRRSPTIRRILATGITLKLCLDRNIVSSVAATTVLSAENLVETPSQNAISNPSYELFSPPRDVPVDPTPPLGAGLLAPPREDRWSPKPHRSRFRRGQETRAERSNGRCARKDPCSKKQGSSRFDKCFRGQCGKSSFATVPIFAQQNCDGPPSGMGKLLLVHPLQGTYCAAAEPLPPAPPIIMPMKLLVEVVTSSEMLSDEDCAWEAWLST